MTLFSFLSILPLISKFVGSLKAGPCPSTLPSHVQHPVGGKGKYIAEFRWKGKEKFRE